jgi:hypothetical protein
MTQDKDRIFISRSTKTPIDAEWHGEADNRGKRCFRVQFTIDIWPWLCKLMQQVRKTSRPRVQKLRRMPLEKPAECNALSQKPSRKEASNERKTQSEADK